MDKFIHKLAPIALSLACLTFSSVATANTTTQSDAQILVNDAKHYAKAYGISETEAMKRILLMHTLGDKIEALKTLHQNNLAGIYFDNGDKFGLTIVLKGNNIPQATKLVRDATKVVNDTTNNVLGTVGGLTHNVPVVNSLDLKQATQILEQTLELPITFVGGAVDTYVNQVAKLEQGGQALREQIPSLNGTYFDERDQIFVVEANIEQSKKANLDEKKIEQIATGILNAPVKVKMSDSLLQNTAFRGGSQLKIADASRDLCTSGFTVKDSRTGKLGIITAGHCGEKLITYVDKDGTNIKMELVRSKLDGEADIAFYAPTSQYRTTKASPSFYADSSANARNLVGSVSVSETNKKTWARTGSFLCTFGHTTELQSCGEVTSLDFKPTMNFPEQCGMQGSGKKIDCGPNFVLIEPKEKKGQEPLRCAKGDSGGPWFAYGNAYGITKGSAFTGNQCHFTFYTPIDRLKDIGVQLYTEK